MTTEEKDVYIKDEGDFVTICFQSNRAKSIIRADYDMVKYLNIHKNPDGSESVKLDLSVESLPNIETWLVSCDLSWESEL